MPHRHAAVLAVLSLLLILLVPGRARAEPWFGFRDNALQERYADGDVDEDDVLAMHLGHSRTGSSDLHGRSWVSLVGYYSDLQSGRRDYGAMAVVGLALDKVAAGSMHNARDSVDGATGLRDGAAPSGAGRASRAEDTRAATAPVSPRQPARPLLNAKQARACVAAAWRAHGLGEDDEQIDAMVSRARTSAAFPEVRLRAMRLTSDAAHTTGSVVTDGTSLYDAAGTNVWLEARMTWRLDRLIYADDEPTLERLRLERQDARGRVSAAVLKVLFQWHRAMQELRAAAEDSQEHVDAELRIIETEAMLDVLTRGWFTKYRPQ